MALRTLAVVMAGGMGERLRPLTEVRAKPAVPFGAIYRIIDFTLSNCINSNLRQILVLTQYKSHSLSRHLELGFNFLSPRLDEFIEVVPAQMQLGNHWYNGTADALRQNLGFIDSVAPDLVLVLAGDHVYKMDYRLLQAFHRERGASLTISLIRMPAAMAAGQFGVMEVDGEGRILGFEEKPAQPKCLPGSEDCLASMGIYVFDNHSLHAWLDNDLLDFGRDVIPAMVAAGDVPVPALSDADGQVLGWRNLRGNVLGHYLHGMFEQPEVMQALFGADAPALDQVFDGLADFIARHFEPGVLDRLIL